jgi:signal peptidase I
VVIKTFLVQPFWIPTPSMVPTIEVNDRVMVNKLTMHFGDVDRGDIVVFRDPAAPEIEENLGEAVLRSVFEAVGVRTRGWDDLIKRVIALPGETISISDNRVLIDGVVLEEPYLPSGVSMRDEPPLTLGPNEIFVMGDNRQFSHDSRSFGPIPVGDVVGKAFLIIWPFSNFGGI